MAAAVEVCILVKAGAAVSQQGSHKEGQTRRRRHYLTSIRGILEEIEDGQFGE